MKLIEIKRNKKLLKLLNKRMRKQLTIIDNSILLGFSDIFPLIFEKKNEK